MEPLIWQLILQFALIVINAFFSAAEVALNALNLSKLRADAEDGNRRAANLLRLAEQPTAALAALQIVTILVGFLASACAASSYSEWLTSLLTEAGATAYLSAGTLHTLAVVVVAVVLSYFTLVLGVLVPRRVAAQKPEHAARVTLPVVRALSVLLHPFSWFLSVSVVGVLRLLGVSGQARSENATEEEIRLMLDESEEEGLIESAEGEMIDNIFEFNNIQIYDVMTHRVDVETIDVEESREEITETIRTTGFSRFPVYEGDPDNIIGLLDVKDFFLNQDAPLRELLKEPIFVPDSMICDALFQKMQREHTHIAIVTDEYGSFLGIISMEDQLEEIVGNNNDDNDYYNNNYYYSSNYYHN